MTGKEEGGPFEPPLHVAPSASRGKRTPMSGAAGVSVRRGALSRISSLLAQLLYLA